MRLTLLLGTIPVISIRRYKTGYEPRYWMLMVALEHGNPIPDILPAMSRQTRQGPTTTNLHRERQPRLQGLTGLHRCHGKASVGRMPPAVKPARFRPTTPDITAPASKRSAQRLPDSGDRKRAVRTELARGGGMGAAAVLSGFDRLKASRFARAWTALSSIRRVFSASAIWQRVSEMARFSRASAAEREPETS